MKGRVFKQKDICIGMIRGLFTILMLIGIGAVMMAQSVGTSVSGLEAKAGDSVADVNVGVNVGAGVWSGRCEALAYSLVMPHASCKVSNAVRLHVGFGMMRSEGFGVGDGSYWSSRGYEMKRHRLEREAGPRKQRIMQLVYGGADFRLNEKLSLTTNVWYMGGEMLSALPGYDRLPCRAAGFEAEVRYALNDDLAVEIYCSISRYQNVNPFLGYYANPFGIYGMRHLGWQMAFSPYSFGFFE